MYKPGRTISGFTTFFNRVLIILLSAGLIVLVSDPKLAGGGDGNSAPLVSAERVIEFKAVLIFLAAVLLCLNLNIFQFVLFNIWNIESRRYIATKTASGTAKVALDAIQRALSSTARAMPEIARCRLEVHRVGHTRFKVSILYWIRDGRSVINISEKLRLVLKKRFSELVTISPQDRVDFDITLAGIQKPKRKGSEPQRSGVGGLLTDFKGPVYPVEGEN